MTCEERTLATATTARPQPFVGSPICDEMHEGTKDLRDILTWQRPHGSLEESMFMRLYVDSLATYAPVERDGFANRWITVGDIQNPARPNILFSCHVDTMAAKGGRQELCYQDGGKTLALKKPKPGRCLGADDGAGVFLLREMIKAGVPGTYVFHRGEEKGRLGSRYVTKDEPHLLKGFDACIAFDRKGTTNIITHQMGERGVSEAFVKSLAAAINSTGPLAYEADSTGSYTDSYTYFDFIPECTNLSVGYQNEHGPRETLDAMHVWKLRNALLAADWSQLVIERDPTDPPVYDADDGFGWGYGGYGSGGGWHSGSMGGYRRGPSSSSTVADEEDLMATLCKSYPYTAVRLMQSYGIDLDDFIGELGMVNLETVGIKAAGDA